MNELRWLAFAEMAVVSLLGSVLGALLKQKEENLAAVPAMEKSPR